MENNKNNPSSRPGSGALMYFNGIPFYLSVTMCLPVCVSLSSNLPLLYFFPSPHSCHHCLYPFYPCVSPSFSVTLPLELVVITALYLLVWDSKKSPFHSM